MFVPAKVVYLIEKAWTDSLENDLSDAFGYAPHSFVATEDDAKLIVEAGGLCTEKCWANDGKKPLYRYKAIPMWGRG